MNKPIIVLLTACILCSSFQYINLVNASSLPSGMTWIGLGQDPSYDENTANKGFDDIYNNTGTYSTEIANNETWLFYKMHIRELNTTVQSPPPWPTNWIQIDWDKNENGLTDDWRDVEYAYYNDDGDYLYLKLECYSIPGSKWPAVDGRYKWFIDLDNNMYFSGNNVIEAEYLLFVEDIDDNGIGELYLVHDDDNDGDFDDYGQWPWPNPENYEITDTSVGDYRIVGNQMEMYISYAALGNPDSIGVVWTTDQENPNLNQAPTTDHPDEETPIKIIEDVGARYYFMYLDNRSDNTGDTLKDWDATYTFEYALGVNYRNETDEWTVHLWKFNGVNWVEDITALVDGYYLDTNPNTDDYVWAGVRLSDIDYVFEGTGDFCIVFTTETSATPNQGYPKDHDPDSGAHCVPHTVIPEIPYSVLPFFVAGLILFIYYKKRQQ